ncbi:MAG: glycosyltransferase family 4 protein [Candidatus Portnoybacteria bacterium]|nr:glycosyltransferase family 4 protein [Candidatus Portnoybacteria bacterium]
MLIGINAVAAFKKPRTGVEEYTYQLIKHLTMLEESKRHRFILYSQGTDVQGTVPKGQSFSEGLSLRDSPLRWPLPMWTQIRLAAEMVINKPDVLFIPVHVLPLVHPQNSVVTIHGLEYEYYPEMYPWRHLRYLRWSTKYALKNARKIIAVSENTKRDLVELYGGNPEKIEVIHHGYNVGEQGLSLKDSPASGQSLKPPYILFIGRLETKKNIDGLIKAFNLLKEKYQVPHKLVLVGPKGEQGQSLKYSPLSKDCIRGTVPVPENDQIIKTGYVSEQEKWSLLKNADLFVLPSFYEGFGMPILEAQAAGCPVITSNISSMPEVAGQGAILVEPKNIEQIAQTMYKVIKDSQFKNDLITKGYQNIKRFSWQKCASKTLQVLTNL